MKHDHTDNETGAALPFVAALLLVLLALSALAVDLGWLYLNDARLQRAADAAALAGVVHLPSDTVDVSADTASAAAANDFPVGVNGTTLSWLAVSDNKLEVTMGAVAPSFFTKVLGFDFFNISAQATAEYIKPVPMGSPSSCFGVGEFATSSLSSQGLGHCNGFTQNFWAAVNGPLTAKEHGDPFAVQCITANSSGCTGGSNGDHRAGNYYYAVEVPAGKSSITVKLFDAGFYDRATFQTETGDGDGLSDSANGGMTTTFQLFRPDSTPLDPTDNSTQAGSCNLSVGPEANSGTYKNRWANLCTISGPTEGIYVLRVGSSNNRGGNNSYSIGVSSSPSSAPYPRVYGINDMSIFTNGTSGTATVYLAELDPIHAGKKLELRFYDPGENSGNAWVEVKRPNGTTPNCSWIAEDNSGTQTASGSGSCRIQSTSSGNARFNAQWLTVYIDIPTNYTCSSDCFWKMALDMGGSQDRTTWTARVIGNPVRLVPNE